MARVKAILSDADGTLVNTLYLIRHGQHEAAVEFLREHGVPEAHRPTYAVYEEHLNKAVGGPVHHTFQTTMATLFADNPDVDLATVDFREVAALLQPVQDRLAPEYVKPYDGLAAFLDWLGKHQIALGINTSGHPHHVVRNFGIALPELGLTKLYEDTNKGPEVQIEIFRQRMTEVFGLPNIAVVTSEDTTAIKPDPEGYRILLERLGLEPNEAVAFGDHNYDIVPAKQLGMASIGITHGFGSREELEAAGADHIVGSFAELIATGALPSD